MGKRSNQVKEKDNMMFSVSVIVKESKEVVETLVVDLKGAEAILKGYQNDDFYYAEASYIH